MTETQLVAWTGANATNTITSGSFTPAANSLVVLVTGCGNSGGVTVTGISVTDSVGGTWKKLVQLTGGGQFADASVWVKDAGSSPSAQTVTVTMFPSSVNDLGLSVRQFTGAASAANQNGATNTASGTIATIGITPNVTGSQVVGAAGWAGSTAGTANASTTLYGQTNDATGGASDGGFKATSLSTGGTPLTLGFTATAAGRGLAVAEILPVPLIPGNELTLNEQSIETDATGWSVLGNSSIAQSTAQAYDGTNSLSITATAAGASNVISATPFPAVTPGNTYQFFFAAFTTTSGINMQANGDFYNGSTFVSSFSAPNIALVPNQWTWVSVTGTAPATSTLLRPIPNFTATGAGQVVFIDSVYFGAPTAFPGAVTLLPVQPQPGGPTWRRRYRRRQTLVIPPAAVQAVNAPAGVAAVSVTAPDAVNPQVTVNAAPAGVTVTAPSPVASVAPPVGVAAVSTVGNPPALSLTANPPAAAVSTVGVQPSVAVSFSAAAAMVTVTANTAVAATGVNTTAALISAVAVQPSVSTTGSVNAPAGVATVSVVAVQPVTVVTVPAGAATVNTSAPALVPLVQPGAAPAVVSATSNPPGKAVSPNAAVSVVSASVPPGKASVAPNALVASVNAVSVQTVTAVTVPSGVSIVNAVAVQPTVSTVPTVNAPAGVATVAVTAMTASTSVTANAAPAVISVTANQTSTAHTANPGVAVIAVADPGSVASTGTTAPAGVATVAVTANPARGGVGPVAGAASVTATAVTAHTGITFGAAVGVVSAVANAASGPPKFIIIGLGIGAPHGKWGAGAPHTSGYSTGETHGGWSAGTAVDNGITTDEPHIRWSTGDPHD